MGVVSGELWGLGILAAAGAPAQASAAARAAMVPVAAQMDVILILWTFVAVSHFTLAKSKGAVRSSIAEWRKAGWRRRGFWRSPP